MLLHESLETKKEQQQQQQKEIWIIRLGSACQSLHQMNEATLLSLKSQFCGPITRKTVFKLLHNRLYANPRNRQTIK